MSGLDCGAFENSLIQVARRKPIEVAARAALLSHLDVCEGCRSTLNRHVRLSTATKILSAEASHFSSPPRVERALRAEMESVRGFHTGGVQRRGFTYSILGGAMAASLAMVWWFASRPAPKPEVARNTPTRHAAVVTRVQQEPPIVQAVLKAHRKRAPRPLPQQEEPFFAIPYTLPLQPYERAEVVRMDLPVTALIAAGVPTNVMDPGARARTDVLFGQDGQARAVRFVSFSPSN